MAYERYEVRYYSVVLRRRHGTLEAARIVCTGSPPGTKNMIIRFWPDYENAPANESILEPDRIIGKMHLPAEQYAWYIDLVRNEKPIRAYVYDDPNRNQIAASAEPPGEEEAD